MPVATVRGPCDKEFMSMRARCWIVVMLFVLAASRPAVAQSGLGRLEGRISRDDGSGVAGATVLLVEAKTTTITAADGSFAFPQVSAGTYTLAVSLGTQSITLPKVIITAAKTTPV